ncbi:MAG: hypothetical protein H7840_01380 [Alphaproteobacteria bacterium]
MIMRASSFFTVVSSVAVVVAVVAGVAVIDSPWDARTKRLDQRRLSDLQSLVRAINAYHGRYDKLPASLGDMQQPDLATESTSDPETNQMYEYYLGEGASYRLCATFTGVLDNDGVKERRLAATWRHGAGRNCFNFTVPPVRKPG